MQAIAPAHKVNELQGLQMRGRMYTNPFGLYRPSRRMAAILPTSWGRETDNSKACR